MSNVCPKGHFSTESDYCSECGARMDATAPPPSASTSSAAADRCPDCGTAHPSPTRFCEVCRFDFQKQASFSGLVAATPPAAPAPDMSATPVVAPVPVTAPEATAPLAVRLLLRIVVDPSLDTDPDPDEPCPIDAPEKVFHLDLAENTLGRQYESNGVHPEIVVRDPGISRRHLKFIRASDGTYTVLELGSINGTELNGATLEAGIVAPVKAGDQLTLGMWTRVHVEQR